jgi:hypothetical protein
LDETPSSKPILRVSYASMDQAESWARSLNVEADYGNRLDIADYCNELLAQLHERNLLLPDRIVMDTAYFRREFGALAIGVPGSTIEGQIRINPSALYWRNPAAMAAHQHRIGYWSSDHPLHALYHEAGHALIYKATPDRYDMLRDLTARQKTIAAGEVSDRAVIDVHEFLSEVFAGFMSGRIFSPDVVRWYRSRGGILI